MGREFKPWKRDLQWARALLYFVPACGLGLALILRDHLGVLLTISILSVLAGWQVRKRVQARRFGQHVERVNVGRAVKVLSEMGFAVEVGRMTGVGDVDLLVRSGTWSATVEIKSFRYWRGRLRDRARQQAARRQARRQRSAVRADVAVIWLPRAWPNWLTRLLNWLFPERNPLIVMGGPRRLAAALRATVRP